MTSPRGGSAQISHLSGVEGDFPSFFTRMPDPMSMSHLGALRFYYSMLYGKWWQIGIPDITSAQCDVSHCHTVIY